MKKIAAGAGVRRTAGRYDCIICFQFAVLIDFGLYDAIASDTEQNVIAKRPPMNIKLKSSR